MDSHTVRITNRPSKSRHTDINFSCKPKDDARIFHIDVDPMKQQIPLFYLPAESRYKASCELALQQLNSALSSLPVTDAHKALYSVLAEEHKAWTEATIKAAEPPVHGRLSTSYVSKRVKDLIPEDAVFCMEPVTETVNVWNQFKPEKPMSYFNSGAGGRKFPSSKYIANQALIF